MVSLYLCTNQFLLLPVMTDIAAAILSLLVILAATADVLSRSIPNQLTLLIAASFFLFAWACGMPLADLVMHVGFGIGLLVIAVVLFSFGLFGGGDGKLIAAAGLWIGPAGLVDFLLGTAVTGGFLALAFLAYSVPSLLFSQPEAGSAGRRALLAGTLPYGYAIAAGTLLALPESWWASPIPQ